MLRGTGLHSGGIVRWSGGARHQDVCLEASQKRTRGSVGEREAVTCSSAAAACVWAGRQYNGRRGNQADGNRNDGNARRRRRHYRSARKTSRPREKKKTKKKKKKPQISAKRGVLHRQREPVKRDNQKKKPARQSSRA